VTIPIEALFESDTSTPTSIVFWRTTWNECIFMSFHSLSELLSPNCSTDYALIDGRVTSPSTPVCIFHKSMKSLFRPTMNCSISHSSCRLMLPRSFDGVWSVVFDKLKKSESRSKLSEIQPKQWLRLKLLQFWPVLWLPSEKSPSLESLAFLQFSPDFLRISTNRFVLFVSTKLIGDIAYTYRIAKMRRCQNMTIIKTRLDHSW
jgi:hypothetical protein